MDFDFAKLRKVFEDQVTRPEEPDRAADSEARSWTSVVCCAPWMIDNCNNRRFEHRQSPRVFRSQQRIDPSATPSNDDLRHILKFHDRMQRVEELGLRLVDALVPWGGACAEALIWGFVETFPRAFVNLDSPYEFARDALEYSVVDRLSREVLDQLMKPLELEYFPRLIQKAVRADVLWRFAVRNEMKISGPPYAMSHRTCDLFSLLANPFELFIECLCNGVVVVGLPTCGNERLRLILRV